MSGLPPGWVEARFVDCAVIKLGKMLDSAKNVGEPTAYLRNINVRWGAFDLLDLAEMRMSTAEQTALAVQDGDLLVCEGGEPGRSAVWKLGALELTFQKALMRVRPRQSVDAYYLAALLRRLSFSGDLSRYFTGTTIKHLPQAALSSVPVPLPPFSEQRRIVAKIDRRSARSKRARAELGCVRSLVDNFKDALLCQAFAGALTHAWRETTSPPLTASVNELNEARRVAASQWNEGRSRSRRYQNSRTATWQPSIQLPPSWRWVSVDDIACVIQYGSSAKTDGDPSGIVVLRMGNIQKGKIDQSDVRFLPPDHSEFPDLLLSDGDLLFNRTNSFELVGKTAIFEGSQPTSFASYLIRLRLVNYEPHLLAHYINSSLGKQWIAAVAAQQVGQANVNGTKLAELAVPFMSIAEQREIVRHIKDAFAAVDRLAAEAQSARALLDRFDQAILAKAFRGELVPQDPNDEPASVLLERIRAERAAAPLKPVRRRKA